MATLEKIQEHIKKTKDKLTDASKKSDDPKNSLDVRAIRKNFKRLSRKAGKIEYAKKKAEEKGKKKEKAAS